MSLFYEKIDSMPHVLDMDWVILFGKLLLQLLSVSWKSKAFNNYANDHIQTINAVDKHNTN